MSLLRYLLSAALGLALGGSILVAADPAEKSAPPSDVSYYRQVRPIFQQHCQGCHQPAKPQGGYVMTSHDTLFKPGEKARPNVVPGKPEASLLMEQITAHDGKPAAMPKDRDPLLARDVEIIQTWIREGAKDDTPASARKIVDMDHPPVYNLPPVITSLDISPDGTLLAVSGFHEVLLHKSDGSELVARLIGESERIQSVSFSPDGKLLAVSGGSPGRFGEVQIWDVNTTRLKLSHPVTFDTIYGASWSPDSSKVAFGCADNSVRAIEVATGKQILFQGAHSDWVLDTVFSRDGNYVVSVSRDMSMKLTEVSTQRFIDNVTSITPGALKGGLTTVSRRPRPKDDKTMSKVPPDTPNVAPRPYDELLIAGSDGVPRLYKMHRESKREIGDDANKVREFKELQGRVFAGCFSPDGSLMAAGSSSNGKGEVRVYQVNDGKIVANLEGQEGAVYALAFQPDGKVIASAGFDGVIRLNEPLTGKLIKVFQAVPLSMTGTNGTKQR